MGVLILGLVLSNLGESKVGPYFGIDGFFVIAGYLMAQELRSSKLTQYSSLLSIIRKALKSIFTKYLLTISVTLLASILFLPRTFLRNYFTESIASALFILNLKMARNGIDLSIPAINIQAFQHLWAIAVLIQMLIFLPLLHLTLLKNKRTYILVICLTFLLSAIIATLFPSISNYLPTSRIWEFFLGAFLASYPTHFRRNPLRKKLLITFAIITGFVLANTGDLLRIGVLMSALSVLLTGVILLFGFNSNLEFLEGLGRNSFAIYLVHWPIIQIIKFYFKPMDLKAAISIFTLICLASFYISIFEKMSIGFARLKSRRLEIFTKFLFPLALVALVAGSFGFSVFPIKQPWRIDTSVPLIYDNGCHTGDAAPKLIGCDFGSLSSDQYVMLVGDSHAAQWFPGFESVASVQRFRLRVATKSGCPAIYVNRNQSLFNRDCALWQRNLIDFINVSQPDVLVISNMTENNGGTFSQFGITPDQYITQLKNFISRVNKRTNVVVIGDTVYPGSDNVVCLSVNTRNSKHCDLPDYSSKATSMTRNLIGSNVYYIDSRILTCHQKVCPSVIHNVNVYRDVSHLSVASIFIQRKLAYMVVDRYFKRKSIIRN